MIRRRWGSIMGQPQPIIRCTPEEYLRRERDVVEKHEFDHGEVFAMSGGTPQHSLIIANVGRELGIALKGKPCRVYDSNLRVRTLRAGHYAYPDISVVCGPMQFDPIDTRKETATNPTLLVEVMSPSTETWDRGGKFASYQSIESLKEYVLVTSDAARIEVYRRQPDGQWLYAATDGVNAVTRLRSIDVELSHAEVYAGADFEEPPETPPWAVRDRPSA
jgi:Uma2 family endonuclease